MEVHDYKIKYKNCEDDVPHIKYIHALDHETAETMFKEDWVREHGDDNSLAEDGDNRSYSCRIMDVTVLKDGSWLHDFGE
jgi:hypothetical protein